MIILLSSLSCQGVNAKCLMDIFTLGFSGDSVSYEGVRSNNSSIQLATNFAYGLLGAWTIFCPKDGVEYQTYSRYRQYTFNKKNLNSSTFKNVPEQQKLFSFGLEYRKSVSWNEHYFDIPIDVEFREELGFILDETLAEINPDIYNNIKLESGIRYYYWSDAKNDFTAVLKAGVLYPFGGSSEASTSILYGLSTEYFRKWSQKVSLRFDLYYDTYTQSFGDLDMNRIELGLRSNLVFRL